MPLSAPDVTTQHFQCIKQSMATAANLRTTTNMQWWGGRRFKISIFICTINKAIVTITTFDEAADIAIAQNRAVSTQWVQDRARSWQRQQKQMQTSKCNKYKTNLHMKLKKYKKDKVAKELRRSSPTLYN